MSPAMTPAMNAAMRATSPRLSRAGRGKMKASNSSRPPKARYGQKRKESR